MGKLCIVAPGASKKARDAERGKLFEKLMTRVLRHHGYEVHDHDYNAVSAGMEIDIEGRARIAGAPLYAECKCYNSDVTAPELQKFFGKYMTKWLREKKSHGLFAAIPGVNGSAGKFYEENCEDNPEITFRLLQEGDILSAIVDSELVIPEEAIKAKVSFTQGAAGDTHLIFSPLGFFWLQYIVPAGSGIASKAQFFDSIGHPITEHRTIDYLTTLLTELQDFEIIQDADARRFHRNGTDSYEEIVELRGSSTCFEYQFPASPEFFVGRTEMLADIGEFSEGVISGQVSSRSLLFEANSGWGKSSLVLAAKSRLEASGHYAISVDSRSASSSHFILKLVRHILDKFGDFDGAVKDRPVVGGFEGAVEALVLIGESLKRNGRLLVVFFDQFENIFYIPDLLGRLARLCLKLTDAKTNICLGFSWKTDLVGLTRDFPYKNRDIVIGCSRIFRLRLFSESEIKELLDRLATELRTTLRKDLRFFLSEFSQGYPWLLKKWCAHVKKQRELGVAQAEMARGLLNAEKLFLDDIEGLTAEQEEALRRLAQLAPVSIADLGEEFSPHIVATLIDRRLIVKVGTKYDVYWDIFRDYLNTGKLPIEEVYLLRAQVNSVLRAMKILGDCDGSIDIGSFKDKAKLSDGTFLNVARDLRLLKLAGIERERLVAAIDLGPKDSDTLQRIRSHLNDRLTKNRAVNTVLRFLNEKFEISRDGLTAILRDECPYISAVGKTWETYARILATWLDLADLAILDKEVLALHKFSAGSRVRDRSFPIARRRPPISVPKIQFDPVLQVAARILSAATAGATVDWAGIKRSTVSKSLSVLEQMKLISRSTGIILVGDACHDFVQDREKRLAVARSAALDWPVFKAFLSILEENAARKRGLRSIAKELVAKCDLEWKLTTAETNSKIMLDWCRHLDLAPGVYAHSRRGRFRPTINERQRYLFE